MIVEHRAGLAAALDLPALQRFLARARRAVGFRRPVTVCLAGDAAMRRWNRLYRGQDRSTDVLSFDGGDIALSLATAARQARRFGHSLELEVRILILHGLLHLAGYDHELDNGGMRRREVALRRRFRLPTGLIERAVE